MDIGLTSEMVNEVRKVELAFVENKLDLVKNEIQKALLGYLKDGEKVTPAPDEYVNSLKAVALNSSSIPTWHVDYDLWVDNKHSDLTLSLELSKTDGKMTSSIHDLHVM